MNKITEPIAATVSRIQTEIKAFFENLPFL